MKKEIIYLVLFIVSFLLFVFGFWHIYRPIEEPQQIVIDHYITDIQFDTIYLSHYDTLEYFYKDTIWENGEIEIIEDTMYIPVPISIHEFDTTIFQGDTIHTKIKGILRGFTPSLEELSIHTEITPRTPSYTSSRWSVGMQLGYGITPKGFHPYLGLGVGYRIF